MIYNARLFYIAGELEGKFDLFLEYLLDGSTLREAMTVVEISKKEIRTALKLREVHPVKVDDGQWRIGRYPAVVEYIKEKERFVAYTPDLKDCFAVGDTGDSKEEVLGLLAKAVVVWKMLAKMEDIPIPKPGTYKGPLGFLKWWFEYI